MQPIVRAENICKSFPGVAALDRVSLDLQKGEVHSLLGENGAGKSTLAKILYGEHRPDGGTVWVRGKPVSLSSPLDAIGLGIGIVHQHFVLAPPMSAIENIVVGTKMRGAALNLKEATSKIGSLCKSYGIDLDLNAEVRQLPVGQQQWVEILKALYLGAEILILDEPTAVLTPQEANKLFAILRKMVSDGLSIVLISHKLHEVMQISNRITVLRKGRVIATVETARVTIPDLARMMVGRDVIFHLEKETVAAGAAVLEIRHLTTSGKDRARALNISELAVRANEIVGLAGVAGNGQEELFDVIAGVRRASGGQVLLAGEDVTNLSPAQMSARRLAIIPPDRIRQGLLMGLTIKDNLLLGKQRKPPFLTWPFLNEREVLQFALRGIDSYEIKAAGPRQVAGQLSGGNLQKLILARVLSHAVSAVLASSPTRGLDVGATEFVHARLLELRAAGAGILLISEDLDEICELSDRIAVIFEGQIVGMLSADEADTLHLGLLMAGVRETTP